MNMVERELITLSFSAVQIEDFRAWSFWTFGVTRLCLLLSSTFVFVGDGVMEV